MLKQTIAICFLVVSSFALNACDAMYNTDSNGHKHLNNTTIGAGVGAVGGGVVGAVVGGPKGAIIGAGAGAVGGGLIGNQMDK